MEAAFAELPLALFTTLAPLSAGAFMALTYALCTQTYTDDQVKALGKWSFVPLAVAAVAFIAAAFHLANPLNAIHALAGVGSSPLSNEVIAGLVFIVLAAACCAFTTWGKAKTSVYKGCYLLVSLAAVVFVVFTGMAYLIETLPSWDSPLPALALICFAVGSGFVFLLALLESGSDLKPEGPLKALMPIVATVGLVAGALIACAHTVSAGELGNALVLGAVLVQEAAPFLIAGFVLVVVGCVLAFLAARSDSAVLGWIAVVVVAVGILCFRLAFYAVRLSVGLAL